MKLDSSKIIDFLVREFDEFHAVLLQQLSRGFQAAGYKIMTYCHGERASEVSEVVIILPVNRPMP